MQRNSSTNPPVNSTDPRPYETTDACVASALLTAKTSYRGCYVNSDGLVSFCFKANDQIQNVFDNYTFDSALPAKSLLANYRFLMGEVKRALRESRRNGVQCVFRRKPPLIPIESHH